MNLFEGARRMQVVGKTITFVGIGLMLLGLLAALVLATLGTARLPVGIEPAAGMLIMVVGFWPLLFGGLLWIAGWILEGFVKPKETHELSRTERQSQMFKR